MILENAVDGTPYSMKIARAVQASYNTSRENSESKLLDVPSYIVNSADMSIDFSDVSYWDSVMGTNEIYVNGEGLHADEYVLYDPDMTVYFNYDLFGKNDEITIKASGYEDLVLPVNWLLER